MNGAPFEESTGDRRRGAVTRHLLIWPAWLLLGAASVIWPWSNAFAVAASGMALVCAVILRPHRRDAGAAFVLAHALLMGGSACVLLTALAFTGPVLAFLERTLAKIIMEAFQAFGAFTMVYAISCVILMAFILASQRDR